MLICCLQLGSVNDRRGKKNLVIAGWGDDHLLSEDCLNLFYVSSNYNSYSDRTQQNLVCYISSLSFCSSYSSSCLKTQKQCECCAEKVK